MDKKGSGRRRWILVAGGGLLFLCICLFGLAVLTGGNDEGEAETAEEAIEEVVEVGSWSDPDFVDSEIRWYA